MTCRGCPVACVARARFPFTCLRPRHLTGGLSALPAFQLSDDGETWDDSNTYTEIANVTPRTTEGVTYHASMETPSLTKRFVRWGLRIKNATSGTTVEMLLGSLRLDFKKG